mmetsp:Transcript_13797/g.39724  ORF Transcript_13797/g.39724 Transcript_13797/m.39724 type:complete len:157 (-) Transcript_13797:182-652(-)
MGNEGSVGCCAAPKNELLSRYEQPFGKKVEQNQPMQIGTIEEFQTERIDEWTLPSPEKRADIWWCHDQFAEIVDSACEQTTGRGEPKVYMVADTPDGALMSTEVGHGVGAMWLNAEDEAHQSEAGKSLPENVRAIWEPSVRKEIIRAVGDPSTPRT